ncbi:MAG: hypothetical protein HYT98_02260 [Candidatus Sungbacteria bacterium]|nr:hypothetical protein [Candidatus Sungbacteria bacterium]
MSGGNPFKGLKLKPAQEKEEVKEQPAPAPRIITKPKKYLESVGITDYTYEEKADGVHFYIKLSPEDMEEKIKQARYVINAPPLTPFQREKLLPFVKLMKQDRKLDCKVLDGNASRPNLLEVVVFKK